MNNCNKTENISDFANNYGLRVETDRFLAPNCKAKTGNNAFLTKLKIITNKKTNFKHRKIALSNSQLFMY